MSALNYKAYNIDQTRKVITYLSKFICGKRGETSRDESYKICGFIAI